MKDTSHTKIKTYQDRIQSLTIRRDSLSNKDKRLSIFRFVYFLILVSIVILSFQWNILVGIILTYVGIYSFYRLILNHLELRYEKNLQTKLIELNEAEIKAQHNDHSYFDTGSKYIDHTHTYTTDLDIFGPKSLFQKLCRCGSQKGRDILASYLLKVISYDDIPAYQEATQELTTEIDFRQKIYASGSLVDGDDTHLEDLSAWIRSEHTMNTSVLMLIGIPLLCLAIFVGIVYYNPLGALNMMTVILYFLISYLPSLYLNKKNKPRIDQTHTFLSRNSKHLSVYAKLISLVEKHTFQASKLIDLQAIFTKGDLASQRIRKIAYYSRQLDQRYNFFGIFLNVLVLWDHYYIHRIQKWKAENADRLLVWFENLGDIEAISSMATLAYNHPTWIYPETTEMTRFTSHDLGHPLLPNDVRVCNNFDMSTRASIKIITGSNMGGKSTFLRTVGINTVLGYMGSVVCASTLHLPDLHVITSMRTVDDLSENTSSFYAELKRLKVVLDAVKRGENVFFLLDEILKGTNSNDRHNGAKALIKQLLKHNGAGLISTHDLELGLMASGYPDQIENKCFEVETHDGKLVFDYLIKDGISKSFNATELMRSMGIDV